MKNIILNTILFTFFMCVFSSSVLGGLGFPVGDNDSDGDIDGIDLCRYIKLNYFDVPDRGSAYVKFNWTPNTESFLAGYKIYYGPSSRNYTTTVDVRNPSIIDNKITVTLSGFTEEATYYFAVVAYDTDGFESPYSTELVLTIP